MATKRKRGRPAGAAARNVAGTGAQPSATEQAEGVTVSAAAPHPAGRISREEFDSLEKKVHQLCIKVGV